LGLFSGDRRHLPLCRVLVGDRVPGRSLTILTTQYRSSIRLFPWDLFIMANQCSGHVFAIVQATNGNILTWRCSDCNSGPFVAIWRCKICGHCRCNACHNAKA
jgi:hypothetical protein